MEIPDRPRLVIYGPSLINVESTPVYESEYEDLPKLRKYMLSMMLRCDGVGLAAAQVGIFKNFVIIQLEDESVIELVNPQITRMYGKELEDYESCLSIPPAGNECLVPRLEHVDVMAASIKYPDVYRPYKFSLMSARVVQHELDHLTGTFFVDRVSLKRKQRVVEEFEHWKKGWEKNGRPFPFGGKGNAARSRTATRSEHRVPEVRFHSQAQAGNGSARS